MYLGLLVVSLVSVVRIANGKCYDEHMYQPVDERDGDFIIVGLFNVGSIRKEIDTTTNHTKYYCDYFTSTRSMYGMQKALSLRDEVMKFSTKLQKERNVTIGYQIYAVCDSYHVNNRVSMTAMNNPKVIGVSGVDIKKFLKESALITTTNYIPTFTYMYSDSDLLKGSQYPTYFAIIDTEENEAEILLRFLEMMGYHYIDIWHHSYSEQLSEYIYHDYLVEGENGCGRIEQVSSDKDAMRISELYNKTGGSPAEVHLIMGNNKYGSVAQLKHLIEVVNITNRIYILGISNGRSKYSEGHIEAVKSLVGNTTNETIIFQYSPLLNTKTDINDQMRDNWTVLPGNKLDDGYRGLQEKFCTKEKDVGNETTSYISCGVTSWSAFVVAGVRSILTALNETLASGHTVDPDNPCNLRQKVYDMTIDPDRIVKMTFEGNKTFNVTYRHKTLSAGFEFVAWSSSEGTLTTLGYGFTDKFQVTNKTAIEKIKSQYRTGCSEPCKPGTYRKFSNTKSLICCWKCHACDGHKYTNATNQDFCHHCPETKISNTTHTGCIRVEDVFLRYNSPKFITGMVFVGLGLILTAFLFGFTYKTEDRPVIKASNPVFLYILLFSIAFGILTAGVPLLRPTHQSCNSEFIMVVVTLSLLTSSLAWRCGSIYGLFSAANNFGTPKCGIFFKTPGILAINLTSMTINVATVIILQQFKLGWRFVMKQKESHTPQVHMCDAVKGQLGYLTILPFIIPSILFITTLFLAFKMRKFPHNFRETSNIFIATLVVLFTSIMFLSGYNLADESIKPFLRAVVLFVTSLAFLICIFFPKIFVIIKKSDIEAERQELKSQLRSFVSKTVRNDDTRLSRSQSHRL